MYAHLAMSFLHFQTLLFFSLTSCHGEIAFFNSPNQELSNNVWLVQFQRRKVAVHIFFGVVPSRAGQTAITFFVLRPILVKLHIRTQLIESFPTTFWTWWCGKEKLHFTPVHTLCQLKRDEALIPPLRRVEGFRARYG